MTIFKLNGFYFTNLRLSIIKPLFIFTFLCLFHATLFAQSSTKPDIFDLGHPIFEAIGVQDENYVLTVTSIEEDLDGFIWIGSQLGLRRYDGYEFKAYRHDSNDPFSLPGDYVTSIVVDKNNNVWVGTQSGGIVILDQATGRFIKPDFTENKSLLLVVDIFESNDKGVWIATSEGLFLLDYNYQVVSLDKLDENSGSVQKNNKVISLHEDSSGVLWFALEKGLYRKEINGSLHEVPLPKKNILVQFIMQDSTEAIWVAARDKGLYKLNKEGEVQHHIPDHSVRTIFENKSGELWVGTRTTGVLVIDSATNKIMHHYTHDSALPYSLGMDVVMDIIIDKAGLVWIGTWGKGVYLHNPHNRAFSNLYHSPTDPTSLSNIDVLAMVELSNEQIIFSPYGNGFDIFDPKKGRLKTFNGKHENDELLKKARITDIDQTTDNSVWMSIVGRGLIRFDLITNKFERVEGFKGSRSFRLTRDGDDALLVITNKGLVRVYTKDNQIQSFYTSAEPDVIDESRYSFIERSPNGTIWLTFGSTLYVVMPNSQLINAVKIVNNEHLSTDLIRGMTIDSQENMYFSTKGGLYKFDDWQGEKGDFQGKFDLIPLTNGSTSGELFEGPNNTLWGSNFVVNLDTGIVDNFTLPDGIGIKPLWSGAHKKTKNGTFLFGGGNGVLMVRPELYTKWDYEPPLVITQTNINETNHMIKNNQVTLMPDDFRVSVEFSALDYTAPNSIKYAYRLIGYADDKWSNVDSKHRLATFTNLTPGSYTLEVKGTNSKGIWSNNIITLPINVMPAWYQTWLFRISLILLILGVFYTVYSLRVRQLQAKRRELEVIVAQRTLSLSDKSKSLEAQTVVLELKTYEATNALQQLISTQGQLVESEKHASLGRLVVGVSHELNTPLGVAKLALDQLMLDAQVLSDMLTSGKLSKSLFMSKNQSITDASNIASSSINRAADLVARFKSISTEQADVENVDVELGQHMRDIVTILEYEKANMKGRIHVYCDKPIKMQSVSEAFLKIIRELLNNAIQHAFSNCLETSRIEIRLSQESDLGNEKAVITFTDNGCGIHAKELPKIFEPFYTTARYDGAVGLGLVMVLNIVTRNLMGTIESVSELESGTQFIMCIPLNPNQLPSIEHESNVATQSL